MGLLFITLLLATIALPWVCIVMLPAFLLIVVPVTLAFAAFGFHRKGVSLTIKSLVKRPKSTLAEIIDLKPTPQTESDLTKLWMP